MDFLKYRLEHYWVLVLLATSFAPDLIECGLDDLGLGLGDLLGGGGGNRNQGKSRQNKKSSSRSLTSVVGLDSIGVGDLLSPILKAPGSALDVVQSLHLNDIIPLLPLDLDRRPYDHPICYNDDLYGCGPQNWGGTCSSGTRQSPINIRMSSVVEMRSNPITYNGAYSKKREFYLANNGHSISIKVSKDGKSDAEFYMSDLRLGYRFGHLHFHWGSTNDQGSEHLLDGLEFPMEMHLVHYSDLYDDTEHAFLKGGDRAAAVIAVFFEIGEFNPIIQPILEAINSKGRYITKGHHATNKELRLYDLIPQENAFFRYEGSLTVPKCTEKILWVVYPEPIKISKHQMATFRKVDRSFGDHPMWNNFRPVQPLNGRQVLLFNNTGRM